MQALKNFKPALEAELQDLLSWWSTHTLDHQLGGFYGQINNANQAINSPKGLVLNARILYTFSSAYLLKPKPTYLEIADRAYNYLVDFFQDRKNGGFYWSLTPEGLPLDTKKQVYGQAFAIYALAEYYKINNSKAELDLAKSTYQLIEEHSFDKVNSGYIEAHAQNWQATDNLRLSEKDQNDKKSMNTHLHIIEAYANLYLVWPNNQLKIAIQKLLTNFKNHIIHTETGHLQLFFNMDWEVKSNLVSFGHDIEAVWLLLEAAEIINDKEEIQDFKILALKMADAASQGLHKNGGLVYEFNPINQHWINEFHWWPQAEAMVGFFNAWQISGNENYLNATFKVWNFIKNHLKDNKNGEWFWGLHEDHSIMKNEDKAGFWKCPYHNGRACIEIIKRINKIAS
ncbi:AGE family epimerase/isomerase [Pedobacter sp. SL55]|uniref:AGE family epimerase/isomerase n=1 Tax=Pedobacter sp. SL55 TaxID=2995161 RepID=UPI002271133D|nr:AGE family epimerase/isomerase [Pedobacter sp. SL55]WAC42454.1 AGE family epimerase/isomerase [Pedobacter sp. SL55]